MKSKIKKIVATLATLLVAFTARADITDGRFSAAQIWDVQYSWNGTTLNASYFQNLYASVNYATQATSAARLTDAQIADASSNGRYFAFFNSTTNPGTYGLALYESDGTLYKIINHTGTFTALGSGAIFYLGNGSWGTVITPEGGYAKFSSGTFTNMDRTVTSADLTSYTYTNTTPLAAGQTASSSSSTPTVVSTSSGTPSVITSTSTGSTTTTTTITNGVTTTVITTAHAVSEQAETQTVDTIVTTVDTTPVTTVIVDTTPVTTTTCTTPTTITTYSDSTTTTTNGTQTCTATVSNTVVTTTLTADLVQTSTANSQAVGKTNQMSSLINIEQVDAKRFDIDKGIKVETSKHDFVSGYSANENRVHIGGGKDLGQGLRLGFGLNKASTKMKGTDGTGSLDTNHAGIRLSQENDKGISSVELNYAQSDYSFTRTIGNWSNNAITNGDNTWVSFDFIGDNYPIRPLIGLVAGTKNIDGFNEMGSQLTARTVNGLSDDYTFAKVGADFTLGLVNVRLIRYTDGVTTLSTVISKKTENKMWFISITGTKTDLAKSNSISAGLKINF
jgi:hypothetical protein